MKPRNILTKKDLIVTLFCIIFLLMSLGAIGSNGRRRAEEAVCTSNLQQWGDAFQMWLGDNDGYFMKSTVSVYGDTQYHKWFNILWPYYGNLQLLFCPEATKTYDGGGKNPFGAWETTMIQDTYSPYADVTDAYRGSYGSNTWMYNRLQPMRWRTANVRGASNIPILLDNANFGVRPVPDDDPPAYDGELDYPPWAMRGVCINRHNGAVNGLFMDFSVRRIGLKELWTLKWHREYDTEGPWTTAGGVQPEDWPEWMQDFEDY